MQLNYYASKFKKQTFSVVLIADQVARPANIGGLFRTADAFGVKKIILGGPRIELNRKTWNTSRATENAIIYKQIEATSEVIKEYKFQSKDFEDLMNENSELKEFCYQQICEACILKYDSSLFIIVVYPKAFKFTHQLIRINFQNYFNL